jgi:DNA-binding transcriptional LysR family regulator
VTLDLRKLRYFIAVYEEGSVTRAAERENIVQPALSVHLRQLEEELGQRLFDRSAQGVHATPAGHQFYGMATDLLARARDARQRMLDGGGRLAGTVRVGLMPSICRGLLGAIRASFVEAHPAVELKILEATSGPLADAVTAGQIDFAIGNAPASQTALKLRLLLRDPVVLVSGAARGLPPGRPLRIAELTDLRLVMPSRQNAIRRLLDAKLKAAEIVPVRFVEIDGLDATMRFLAGSTWSSVIPGVALGHDRRATDIILNPLTDADLLSDIYVLHAADRPLTLPAQSLVDAVHQALRAASAATA